MRQGISAGEPLPPVLYHPRFRERFGVEILDGLGSTEALHIFLSNRTGGQVHPGSSGTPVTGVPGPAAGRARRSTIEEAGVAGQPCS